MSINCLKSCEPVNNFTLQADKCIFSSNVGSLAIPLALSVVCRPCRLQQLKYCGYERKYYIHANVSHMPGLCLIDIDGAPHISYNIMPPKAYFHIFDFFFETTNRWRFIFRNKKMLVSFLSHPPW